jgi:hypothetical protein
MCKIKLAYQLERSNFKCNHRHMKLEHTVRLLSGKFVQLNADPVALTRRHDPSGSVHNYQ